MTADTKDVVREAREALKAIERGLDEWAEYTEEFATIRRALEGDDG